MSLIEAKRGELLPQAGPASAVLVLLAGGAVPAPVARALGCSLLDLEVGDGRTLLEWWAGRDWCGAGAARVIRTTRGSGSPAPADSIRHTACTVAGAIRLEHHDDAAGPRGSAGALRDASADDDAGTTIIAAESSTAMLAPLEPILASHAESGADISLVATTAGRPAGLAILQRCALDLVKPRGYVDFKEQFLPAFLKTGRRVNLVEVLEDECVHMHDRAGVIAGVLRIASPVAGPAGRIPPQPVLDPRWGPSVVSPTATVHESAMVSASLVLAGASVGPGAVVARSIVAAGAAIPAGAVVIDRIVTRDRSWSDEHLTLETRRRGA